MIVPPEPITVFHVYFVVLSAGVILLAWSRWNRFFLSGLVVASALMLATWLSAAAFAVLVLFLLPPYLAAKYAWGRQDGSGAPTLVAVIVFEVILFILVRRYEWGSLGRWPDHDLTIIGISYMLFRTIHLVVDAPHLGHLPFNFGRYIAYVAAFWTLISGPIQRYEAFSHGLASVERPDASTALASGHRATNGLIKAFLFAPIFLKAADINALRMPEADWLDFLVVFYAFPVYLYLNFSGYTDIVIAVARLCGMTTMPENFNRPYLARNIQDFWSRWHISFSVWIRHYVFTPLARWLVGSVEGRTQNLALAFAVLVTFVIVGAWHGPTANFVVFGLLHGGAVVVTGLYGGLLKRSFGGARRRTIEQNRIVHFVAVVLCFHYVCGTLALVNNGLDELTGALGVFFGRPT